jgi:predicted AlkP superfamily phosphohydrolase/phosphomutase/tetratricopeptide (TPR) repeat protein
MASVLSSRAAAPARRVLLVGWDGADWKIATPLIEAGQMPQLANMVAHGASGPLASLPPYLSPMLWNSIATGKYADKHGILGFASSDPETGRLKPMASTERRCKALWNILGEQGLKTHVIGWFASHPAENLTGVCVTEALPRPVAKGAPWPVPAGSVHPASLADEIAELRLRPEDVSHDVLRLFIPRLAEIDPKVDRRPEQLMIRLAELYTVHNAAIAALDQGDCDFLAVYFHFIDWVCHDFMNYHPPRRPQVPERDFELYQDVVKSAYRLQDLLLRDLLAHAGPDTTVLVCSDHGFQSDERRPTRIPAVTAGIALWHRSQGLLAAAGPGIAREVTITGATLLDITPTILRLFGLPAASDMDGRVLDSALIRGTAPAPIPSYEDLPGPFPRPRHLGGLSTEDQSALLEQFAALGYFDFPVNGPESPAALNARENRWNLAITLRHAGRNEEAAAELHALHLERPEEPRYAFHLAMCLAHLGLVAEAEKAMETIRDYQPGNAQAALLLAEFSLAVGDPAAALSHLADAVEAGAVERAVALIRGKVLLRLDRVLEAAAAFRLATELDDEDPVAWLGYAQALQAAGQFSDAEACARQTLALDPAVASGHFTLGVALAKQGRGADARAAFERAAALNPRHHLALRALEQVEKRPYVAVIDFSETLPPDSDELRAQLIAAHATRIDVHRETVAASRADARPFVRYAAAPASALESRPAGDPAEPIVIVSGLPRSGTSVMMQMLARGGLPPKTDERREADEHNPEGYFEWEEIRNLPRDPALITRAAGHAVKVVSPLLAHLPAEHRYKVIFMRRPPAEVARSQHKMRGRLAGEEAPAAERMLPLLAQHQAETLAALREAPHVELFVVDYPALVADPATTCTRLVEFLGAARLPSASEMPSVVRPELHREKETA